MGNEATWQEATTVGRFAGKTVIVTGAASGIGHATALRIAEEGGCVIAADISTERLDDLVAENAGLDLVPVAGDISTEETVAAGPPPAPPTSRPSTPSSARPRTRP